MKRRILIGLVCSLELGGCSLLGISLPGLTAAFTATLDATNEVPANATTGAGEGGFTLNLMTRELTFDIRASGLSGSVTAAHLHNAAAGTGGGVVVDILPFVSESGGEVTVIGTVTLSESDVTELNEGRIYVNLHTAAYPKGEIRGQLLPGQTNGHVHGA